MVFVNLYRKPYAGNLACAVWEQNVNAFQFFIRKFSNIAFKFYMDNPAFFFTIFLWFFLLSITAYSIYVGFGPPSKRLRDPFEEHED